MAKSKFDVFLLGIVTKNTIFQFSNIAKNMQSVFFSSKHRLKSHLWDFRIGASWCRFFLSKLFLCPQKYSIWVLLVYLTIFLPKSLNDKTILDGDGTIGWQWPTPPPPSHHILILLPKLPNPPPPLSSHFRISYILQISAFFLFSNFRKGRLHYILLVGWLVSWLASPLIFLLQMIPLFPSLVFFSSVDQIFSFAKYFPHFPSFFVFSTKRYFPSSLFISSTKKLVS